jgi:hypothetical protein
MQSPKVCCFEITEINPTLDKENLMAENAFEILLKVTNQLMNELGFVAVGYRVTGYRLYRLQVAGYQVVRFTRIKGRSNYHSLNFQLFF